MESVWENGKSSHRPLYNFGRADLIKKDKGFLNMVKRLCEIAEVEIKDAGSGEKPFAHDCTEAVFYNYGYLAYLRLWEELGIGPTLEDLQKGTKIKYSLSKAAFLMAAQHLLDPMSKLSTFSRQSRYFNMDETPLHILYRALDALSKWKEDIESEMFEHNYVRANKKVDVVFYDVTTFAFESVTADSLKDFGYSKDCKFNEMQVVLGMAIDSDGLPVGYELFPGDTFDGNTMADALSNIKRRFGIRRVVIVADRGLNSKLNLKHIEGAGYGYVMSSKIKGMNAAMKAKILGGGGFTVVYGGDGGEDFRYKTIEYVNEVKDDKGEAHLLHENLVITYSERRAAKDRKDRERLVAKAKSMLEHPDKINASNKRGGKKYIAQVKPNGQAEWKLAVDRIKSDEAFDGYYGIQTSETEMAATDVIDAYHSLWKIEESFRVMKSTMEVRPIFHWTPKRIEGHFVVCFLAFLMERTMENLLKSEKDGVLSSPTRIQEALNTMQLAGVRVDNKDLFIKAKADPLSSKIFKRLKMKLPSNINTKLELIELYDLNVKTMPLQMEFK